MYSRQEAAQLKQAFWTTFGHYMAPVLSAEGEKVAWVNYKTGEKHIFFRMNADGDTATVSVDLTHPDRAVQEIYLEQFVQLKALLAEATNAAWEARLHVTDGNGKTVSRIFTRLHPISLFKKEDWPALISFFKQCLTGLDRFWSDVKYSFEALR